MVFTSITHPANIYDAIVVKYPPDIPCTSPNMHGSICSLEEQLEFIRVHKIEKALIIADSIGFITSCPSLKYFELFRQTALTEDLIILRYTVCRR